MSKNQKEMKKFPKVKVILNTVLALLFGSAGPLAETFVQNNVQTAASPALVITKVQFV